MMSTPIATAALYARVLRHVTSVAALAIAFLWGLAEGTFFFIVPDVYIGLVALFHWRRGLAAALAAVAGAMLGGLVLYGLVAQGLPLAAWLLRIPGISERMVQGVAAAMQAEGLLAMLRGLWQGIPYKVYAVTAAQQGLPLAPFLALTVPARLQRLLPVAVAAAVVGVLLRRRVQRSTWAALLLYGLLWVAVYTVYFGWVVR